MNPPASPRPDRGQPTHARACPKCARTGTLWEAVVVPGWRSLDEHLRPHGERDVDWSNAEFDPAAWHQMGCGECGWEGLRSQLVALGIDGEPLAPVLAGQLEIES